MSYPCHPTGGEIFVQIASYRDPELVPTVLDCLARAKYPEKLTFGICWQFAEGENIGVIAGSPKVKLLPVPYHESRGACWARSLANGLFSGQDFHLQIDSHSRFMDGWDEKLIRTVQALEAEGVKKPLVTGYLPGYTPKNDPAGRASGGIQMDFNDFSDDCVFTFGSSQIKDWDKRGRPMRGRFFSGHFAFARGSFPTEVPYDPGLYFQGEEMAMSLRAFCHGYDIYYMDRPVLWHHYGRSDEPKHWKDHGKSDDEKIRDKKAWEKINQSSFLRTKRLFSFDGHRYEDVDWGAYGRGTVRSIRDYELFAGIDFRQRRITKGCMAKTEPPATWDRGITQEEWDRQLMRQFEHTIEIMPRRNGEEGTGLLTLDDYDFVYVGYDRADGTNVYCTNLRDEALKRLTDGSDQQNGVMQLRMKFFADEMPAKWVFWPHSRSKGWVGRVGGYMPKLIR